MIYIIGPLSIDYIATADGALHEALLGGGAAYSAVGARVWSQDVAVISSVNTHFPKDALDELSQRGIDTKEIREADHARLAHIFIAYDSVDRKADLKATTKYVELERNIPKELLPQPGSTESKTSRQQRMPAPTSIPDNIAESAGVHMAAVDIESAKLIGQHIQSFRKPVISFDPHSELMDPDQDSDLQLALHDIDIFCPSEHQSREFFRPSRPSIWDIAKNFAAMGPEVIVIKRGEHGQAVYQASTGRKWHVPAYAVHPIDVTGAGHVFAGAFLAGYVQSGGDPVQASAHGSAAASLAVEGVGCTYALEALPGLAQARRDRVMQGIQSA